LSGVPDGSATVQTSLARADIASASSVTAKSAPNAMNVSVRCTHRGARDSSNAAMAVRTAVERAVIYSRRQKNELRYGAVVG
jgi:uncharacterized protein (DUF2252 family)